MQVARPLSLAASFDWSSVNSFIDLGGDIGHTALELLSKYENIGNAAVLESPKSLQNASKVARELRKQFGEKNFNKLVYVTGDLLTGNIPHGYDVYIIRDNNTKSWNDEHWTRLLKKLRSVLALSGTKSVLIVTSMPSEVMETLSKHDLHVWNVTELDMPERVSIIEARTIAKCGKCE
jgi:maltose-binding protein MalE